MKERDCANCKHHTEDGCSSWDCEFEAKDLISRADAMSKCKNAENELTDEAERRGVRVARFIIGELPSADSVSREFYEDAVKANIGLVIENRELKEQIELADAEWIPCSERLPSEKDGQVLVTKHHEVRIATYSEFSGTWYVGEMCAVGGEDPIAWMPLPKPYKGGDDE